MSTFYTILPPPQSIDTLDSWGDVDSLRWLLDSEVWTKAGVYGLVASEGGESGERLVGARVRLLSMRGGAETGGSMHGVKAARVYDISCQASAKSGGAAGICRIMQLEALAEAESGEDIELGRVLFVACNGDAVSGEDIRPTYKGWEWNGKTPAPASHWERQEVSPDIWVQQGRSMAVWTTHDDTRQGWTQKIGGNAVWR